MATIMGDERAHGACVDAWMDRSGKRLPARQLLDAFELGFAVIWRRAHQTLGDVTLTAIADRVLCSASERFPAFSLLKVDATGLQCKELHEQVGSLSRDQLAAGIRFVLVEFLTVLGSLTAEILTPALHSELATVVPNKSGPNEKEPQDELEKPESKREKAKS